MSVFSTIRERSLLELGSTSIRWVQEGLGVFLPKKVKDWRWRPYQQLHFLDQDLKITKTELQEKSLFGSTRTSKADSKQALPLFINLPSGLVYCTLVSLPKAAAGNLESAIALRLKTLSPLPAEETAFALSTPSQENDSRLSLPVAMVRQSTLGEVSSSYDHQDRSLTIGHTSQGGIRFCFEAMSASDPTLARKNIIKLASVTACTFLTLWGIAQFAERQTLALKDYQAELTKELRAMRGATDSLATTISSLSAESILESEALLAALVTSETTLPSDGLIENITYQQENLMVSGYLPETSENGQQGRAYAWQVRGSTRPGFVSFTQSLPLEQAP